MRVESEDLDAEVAGTTVRDSLEVNAWRGGVLVAEGLQVASWSWDWDADRAVQGQCTVEVADPDGDLAPWGYGDALAPGGSRLQVTWVSGTSGIRVPLGWWRIRGADPREQWRIYTHPGGSVTRVPGGGVVTVRADEETATMEMERLDAEVVTASTCLGETRRLLANICPVIAHDSVIDAPAPTSLVYGDSRLAAVTRLLDLVDATYRMGPDGAMEVVPRAGVGPVWTIAGGDQGVLVDVTRALSDEGLYNAVVSSAETPTGLPLVGRAYLDGGPLEYGGSFGRVPLFHQAPGSVASQSGVTVDAQTRLATRASAGEVDIDVTCLTHPALQVHDVVTVLAPTRVGDVPITGRVVGMSMSSAGSSPAKAMGLRVRVRAQALEAIAARVRRG